MSHCISTAPIGMCLFLGFLSRPSRISPEWRELSCALQILTLPRRVYTCPLPHARLAILWPSSRRCVVSEAAPTHEQLPNQSLHARTKSIKSTSVPSWLCLGNNRNLWKMASATRAWRSRPTFACLGTRSTAPRRSSPGVRARSSNKCHPPPRSISWKAAKFEPALNNYPRPKILVNEYCDAALLFRILAR